MLRDILLRAAIRTLDLNLSSELQLTSCLENFEGGCASVPSDELVDGEFCGICAKWQNIHAVDRLLAVMEGRRAG